jgi:hypothetical protein
MLKLIRPLLAVPLLALAMPAVATDFDDRDLLKEILTLDEQAPLADAEEDLAKADELLGSAEMLRDAAKDDYDAAAATAMELDGLAVEAEEAFQMAVDDGVMGDELAMLEMDAAEKRKLANEAKDAADGLFAAYEDAQGKVDTAQGDYDAAKMVVDSINAEIDGTREFVDGLDDDQAFALNRSLNNASKSGLLPLDIDLDVLSRIVDENLANGEIQQLTHAYEMEARFERLAARFDAKGDGFEDQADRARSKGADSKQKFLCRIGDGCDSGDDGTSTAQAVAEDAASELARNAVGETMRDVARSDLKGAARKAAATAAQEAAKEAAEEVRDENRGRGLAKGLSK